MDRAAHGMMLLVCAFIATAAIAGADTDTQAIPTSTVGFPVELNGIVLPGSEVEPVPLDDETPVVIRIDAVYPHGTDHRYDLVVSALEPGTFHLRDYLRRKDGTPVSDLPPLAFTVETLLPPGQIEPHRPIVSRLPRLGGYRLLLAALGITWLAVMAWLLWPRRKIDRADDGEEGPAPRSFADRLRPLVNQAVEGRSTPAELAELERAVVEYWRRRIGLHNVPPSEVISQLRRHPDASPLLLQVEDWLHRPGANGHTVDVNSLLAPYRDSPADAAAEVPLPIGGANR